MTRLPKLSRNNNGERLTVVYDEDNQATVKNGSLLSSYIGSEVCPSLGLKYTGWKEVPVVVKNKLWEDVMFKFDIDESRKKDILRQFSDLWRGWRKRTAAKHHNPKHKAAWECGFYVMLYMKHIIESHDAAMRNPKEMFKSGMNYSTLEIDEMRKEWIDYISPILEKY